jgi:hypothetical protein
MPAAIVKTAAAIRIALAIEDLLDRKTARVGADRAPTRLAQVLRSQPILPGTIASPAAPRGAFTMEVTRMKALWRSLPLFALLVALAAWLPVAAAAKAKADEPEPFKRLSIKEVEKKLGQPNVFIYDGNSEETYEKGHVPGAVNLHSGDIKESVLPADKDATLIFYCQNTL